MRIYVKCAEKEEYPCGCAREENPRAVRFSHVNHGEGSF